MIELRLEHAFFIGLNRMEMEAMNDEIAALEEPLQAVLLLGPLEEAQALPTAPVLQPIIHRIEWRLGRPGRFHHVIKSDKVPVYTRWLKRLSDDDDDVMISSM